MHRPFPVRLLLLAALLAAQGIQTAVPSAAAQSLDQWRAYTSMSDMQELLPHDGDVWAISNGGVLRYNTESRSYQRYTRLDGLAGNLVSSVAADSSGDLWFGTDHQGLSRFHSDTQEFGSPFREFDDLHVKALLPHGDRLFVATDRGISAFLIDKEEVKESYRQLGMLRKDAGVESLALFQGRLWAGTDHGISSVPLDSPNLQDPDNWDTLITNQVRDFFVHADTLFCATRFGVWALTGAATRLTLELPNVSTVDLELYAGQLHVVDEDGTLWVRQARGNWQRYEGVKGIVRGIARLEDALWLATPQGLRVLGGEQPPALRDPDANYFYEMALTPSGELWVASVPKDNIPPQGVYELNGDAWSVHDKYSGLPSDFVGDVATDATGRVWVGTWGGGLAVRSASGSWSVLNEKNSPLQGCCGNSSFVVITDIKRDAQGIMWVGNIRVGLVAMDGFPPQRTVLYDQHTIGVGAERDMGEFAIGPDGIKWISTAVDGFVLFDDGGTPFTKGDEHYQSFNTLTETRLSSDRTSTILVDRDGRVWVGTDNGLNRVTGSYSRATQTFVVDEWRVYNNTTGLPASSVNCLAEDGGGNMWVGTDNGLAQIDAHNGSVAFTLDTSNSGLIDNRVNSLLVDTEAGDLWIGTLNGLSRLHMQYDTSSEGKPPVAYPNPLVLESGGAELTLTGLPLGARVDIFTLNGDLVRRIDGTPGQGTVIWDTLNDGGFQVDSGVYLYVAHGGDGEIVRGKFAAVSTR